MGQNKELSNFSAIEDQRHLPESGGPKNVCYCDMSDPQSLSRFCQRGSIENEKKNQKNGQMPIQGGEGNVSGRFLVEGGCGIVGTNFSPET